jgi:hypothetical protein
LTFSAAGRPRRPLEAGRVRRPPQCGSLLGDREAIS